MGKSVKVYRVFNEGKEIAIGTPREIAEQLNVTTATVGTWVFKGKQERFINSGYKYALLDSKLSQERFPEHYFKSTSELNSVRKARVFDLYIDGNFSYTGTVREISEYTKESTSKIYGYVAKDHSVNFEKKYCLIEVGKREVVDKQRKRNEKEQLENYKSMTKEERAERRYKRKLKMKMMIEKMQKEELGL
ncbi:DUF658 family protein [Lactococcus lactis subsp. lactis]|uniref:DUF658 family protein n=1 Tax=Lactococcus lactis TaxID=1358 RepID=UPI0020791992|nr:DUF658 family protein [Lactococcus lactis]USI63853.1 DUF658 family protein [Lactococcus lactis subsp. lactis]